MAGTTGEGCEGAISGRRSSHLTISSKGSDRVTQLYIMNVARRVVTHNVDDMIYRYI